MKKFGSFLLWSIMFLLLLVGVDQFFLRTDLKAPPLGEVRAFYLDFRTRLLHLPPAAEPPRAKAKKAPEKPPESGPRYVYVDDEGDIAFADSLEEVPPRFRKDAKPMEK